MPHKYGYNEKEQLWMFIFSGLTNFCFTPGILIQLRYKRLFEAYIGGFTMLASFMYHALESLAVPYFFLEEGRWHRLDNIGSILCCTGMIIHIMDNDRDTDMILNYSALFLVIIAQERKPWDLDHTLYPIYTFLLIWLLMVIFRRRLKIRQFNHRSFIKAMALLGVGVYFFAKGLDENKDYLRLHHGMWHVFMGLASVYIFQIRVPEQDVVGLTDIFSKRFYDFRGYHKKYMQLDKLL